MVLKFKESEENDMMIKKLVVGLVLGLTLVAGASGTASTAEAKAKPVVVTVDKADASTAKKVDTAFKKGKAVTLKVRGSKKASKKLLISLQKKTAKTMRYAVHFDLDNGNEWCQGKGNKFHTYKDLDYKQSGNYGCYTFSKSTCNAYKYAFKFIKGNVDERVNPVKIEKAYAKYKSLFEEEHSGDSEDGVEEFTRGMTSLFDDIIDSNWYNINEATYKFFEDFVSMYPKESLGEVAEGSVDKLVEDALANGAVEDVVEELVDGAEPYDFRKSKPEPMTLKEWLDDEIYNFYKGGSLKPDFSREFNLTLSAIYLGDNEDRDSAMVYGGKKGMPEYDSSRKMKAYELKSGTDEFRFKSLVNKTAHGVCEDFACVNRALIDYLGWHSYRVANYRPTINHSLCALNYKGVLVTINNERFEAYYSSFSKPFDPEAVPYDDEETIQNFEDDWNMAKNAGWEQCFKDAMGSDYPF